METNDSNTKPQQTGGLKLMTVFVAVLALHGVVIGGFLAYHLLKGESPDADLLVDKAAKGAKSEPDVAMTSDNPSTETSQADKTTTAPAAPADIAGGTTTVPAPSSAGQTATPDNNPAPATTGPVAATSTTTPPAATIQRGPVVVPPQDPAKPSVTSSMSEAPEIQPATVLDGASYVVKQGDSLAKIAHHNHTSVAKLRTANSLTNDMLHIGQKLVIPASTQVASATMVPTPAASPDVSGSTTILGDSATTPSMKVPAPVVRTATATPREVSDSTIATPAAHHAHTYTVMKGDTLTKIAHKFKTTPTAIMTANNITDAAKLSIGKKLKIPSQESRSATNVPSEPAAQPAAAAAQQSQPTQESQPSQEVQQTKSDTTPELANFVQ